tara:strand:+ start:2211 stop:2408 length:198 start_codon:yes stop_codon:yes gene_type:complete
MSDYDEDYEKYVGQPTEIISGLEKYIIEKVVEENPSAFEALKHLSLDVVVDEDGNTKIITRVDKK